MRHLFASLLLIFSLSACALGTEHVREIQLTVIPMEETEDLFARNIESTQELIPTETPTLPPTASVPQPTLTPAPPSIRNTSNYSVRTDLPSYRVAVGDTLSNIAARYNTSAAQLSQYNCLTDANLISVGMSLRVPILPTATFTPTPTFVASATPIASPTITELGIRGTLSVYPALESGNPSDWNDYVIEPQTPFTVNWTGIEPEFYTTIVSATFFFTPDVGATIQMGVDNDISDGMSITWTPPAGVSGLIIGSARTVNNGFYRSSTLHVREPNETQSE